MLQRNARMPEWQEHDEPRVRDQKHTKSERILTARTPVATEMTETDTATAEQSNVRWLRRCPDVVPKRKGERL